MKVLRTKWQLGLAALVSLAWTGTSLAGPDHVEIDAITYAGTGCPAGSVAENLSDDFQAFTLLFDDYVAEVGPGVPFREKRKNCSVNIDLHFPQGWQFTLFEVDYRGYVALDRRVRASQKTSYYFQGQRGSATLRSNYVGELDEDYEINDALGLRSLVWSPCGANRALNMKTQVILDNRRNRRGNGLITVDSIDGQLTHIYGIQWRRCW